MCKGIHVENDLPKSAIQWHRKIHLGVKPLTRDSEPNPSQKELNLATAMYMILSLKTNVLSSLWVSVPRSSLFDTQTQQQIQHALKQMDFREMAPLTIEIFDHSQMIRNIWQARRSVMRNGVAERLDPTTRTPRLRHDHYRQ